MLAPHPEGAVSFAVVSGPASVSYRTVTPSGVGRVVVSATVAGDQELQRCRGTD